ncbi:hypothetical protein ACP70R_027520 [Stipagrostis hirtigluma subsp. patula]
MDSTGHVPIVDLSKLRSTLPERSPAVQTSAGYARTRVINHGISTDILHDALDAAAAFFDLPMGDRSGLASDDVTMPVRYSTVSEVDNGEVRIRRQVLKQYSYPLEDWIGKWPAKPLQYREKMAKYAAEIRRLVSELVEAITESLGLGRGYLRAQMERGFEMMALNCYPPPSATSDGGAICCAAHTDYTLVTVLLASREGLEEFDREAGSWRAVPHDPGSLVVHVGNYLEVVSNGRYRAATHRVVAFGRDGGGGARVSIASLPSLGMDERVEVAKELVDARHPALYTGSTLREFIEFLSAGGNGSDFVERLKINNGSD